MKRLLALLVLTLAVAQPGCSKDDPTTPTTPLWVEETLPALPANTALLSLDIDGALGVAAGGTLAPGVGGSFSPMLLMRDGGAWEIVPLTPPESGVLFTGVVLVNGAPVAVGAVVGDGGTRAILYDGRTESWVSFPALQEPNGLNAVAAGGGTVYAVGFGASGLGVRSVNGGAWEVHTLGLNTPQEAGLSDIQYTGSGEFLACGWNDAGPQYRIVQRYQGGVWSALAGPSALSSNADYNVVWGTSSASFSIGGAAPVGDGTNTQAFLSGFGNNDWFEVVLPEPERLQAIQDMVRVGSLGFLACGETRATLLGPGETSLFQVEYEALGRAHALAQGTGALYACVSTDSGSGTFTPRILRRLLD